MPHQCIRCGKEYSDGSDALLTGCTCGARFFFFFKEKLPEKLIEMSKEERKEVFRDVKEIIGEQKDDKPVILDLESIRVLEPGKYEIDIVNLFKRKPVIYKHGEGKYMIDVDSTFKFLSRKK
jgi:hypothetical protein